MGIRIDGNADVINAADGTLTVEGLSVNVVGVSTASGGFKVGTAYTVFPNGNVATAGIITATGGQFNGDLLADALYTSDAIIHRGESGDDTKIRFPSDDTFTVETAGNERIRVDSDGKLGVNNGAVASIKAQLDVINTTAPTLDNNTHAGEALFLRSGGSDGNGNVQAVIAFGKADSSSLRSGSAVASVQTDSDADKIGIGFYTSPSSTSSQTLSFRISS